MLQTVKEFIKDLPEESFAKYYQKFVCNSQDGIIHAGVKMTEVEFKGIENIKDIITGINLLTEELKAL